MLVDSHFHLDYFPKENHAEIIAKARNAGVLKMQTICTRFSKALEIIKIAEKHNIYASIGTHPENAHDDFANAKDIINLANSNKRIVGIGETGLDYYHSTEFIKEQKACFQQHILATQETGKVLIVHTRNADDDTLSMLSENKKIKDFKILMHCFTGGKEFAFKLLDIGAFISFSGIVTFKNANEVFETMMSVPLEKMLIETDAPFLAPVPMRGKQNEPAFVKHVAEFIAEKRGFSLQSFAFQMNSNFEKLFLT